MMSNIISFDEVFSQALKLPGIRIDRKEFLESNFSREFDPDIVNKIVETSPILVGVDSRILNKIARECISYEKFKVSAISAGSGVGGVGTIVPDLCQYIVHVIRIAQKLAYVYGWPELISVDGNLDDETKSILLLFIGRMYGVHKTNMAIQTISAALTKEVVKRLSKAALTKTVAYPLIKEVGKTVGITITKKIAAEAAGKAVPIFACVISGGLTYYNFGKGATKLQESLSKAINK